MTDNFVFLGDPPLVCSPLCKARLCKFTPRGAFWSWSVSTSAEVDLRNFFEKKFLKNFQKTFLMIVLIFDSMPRGARTAVAF